MPEFCANVPVTPQPSPAFNAGGDCFACALTSALAHFYPDRAPAIADVFAWFQEEQTRGDTGEKWTSICNTWDGVRRAVSRGWSHGYRVETVYELVLPTWDPEQWAYEWWRSEPGYRYGRTLDAYLRAGWLALSVINYAGAGPVNPDGTFNSHDHFVLLDGVRHGWRRDPESGAGRYAYDVHVVCSAAGGRAYWIPQDRLLRKHGASAWIFVRSHADDDLPAA